jgi:uncharacterized protein (DUF924 family)
LRQNTQSIDLSKIITPELLEALRRVHLPWPEDQPLDWNVVVKQYFRGSPSTSPKFYDLTFEHALRPISTIGIENIPDFMQFLPSPEAKDFPSKALGLLLLLDQAPRSVLSGMNERWTYSYFDVLALKLVEQLHDLPPALQPDNIDRLMAQGWSFDYSAAAWIWLTAPLVHSESIESHEQQLIVSEKMRKLVEKHVGMTDPYRATEEEDSKDIYGFPNLVVHAPVQEGAQIEDFMFWLLRLFRVHTPLIRKFGHYPYRNNSVGRVSTKEEIQYAEDTSHFAMLDDEEIVRKIREDVKAGRWTPLQDEPTFSTQ